RTGVGLPLLASLMRTWTVSMTAPLAVLRPGAVEQGLVGVDGPGEQLGAGDPAGGAAAFQVRLQDREAVVSRGDRGGDDLGPAAVALAGQAAVLLAGAPVLDVEVGGVGPGRHPALPGVVAAEDEVGGVVGRPESGAGHRRKEVGEALRRVAIDAV